MTSYEEEAELIAQELCKHQSIKGAVAVACAKLNKSLFFWDSVSLVRGEASENREECGRMAKNYRIRVALYLVPSPSYLRSNFRLR